MTSTRLYEIINESNFWAENIPLEEENLSEPYYLADIIGLDEYPENLIDMKKAFNDVFNFNKQTIELKEEEEEVKEYKIVLFKPRKPKKRGRKKSLTNENNLKKPRRKMHCKTDYDNVLTKIQVNFLTFIINITNDIIEQNFKEKNHDIYFRQINYKVKKNIKLKNISRLKNSSIKDILQMEISRKFRKDGEDYNKNNYINILEQINKDNTLNWINNFFNMNYLDLFEKYYDTFEKKNNFIFLNRKINFSKKTKSNLLEKDKTNQEMQECIKKISERYLKRENQES